MKKLRQLTGTLLVLAGLLHFLLLITESGNQYKAIYLFYGCLYLVSGLVFFTKQNWATWLGLLFPLSGIILEILLKGMTKPGPLLGLLLILDLVVMGFCVVLLLRPGKT